MTGFGLSPWAWWGAEPPGPTPLPLPGCSILAPLSTQSRRPQARELPRFCLFSPPRRRLPPTARQKPSMFKTYSKSDHFPSALQLPRWSQAPLLLAGREQWLLRWPPSPSSRGSAVTLSAVQQTGEHLCSSTSRLQWPPMAPPPARGVPRDWPSQPPFSILIQPESPVSPRAHLRAFAWPVASAQTTHPPALCTVILVCPDAPPSVSLSRPRHRDSPCSDPLSHRFAS